MNKLKDKIYFKLGSIVLISLILLIPTAMIKNLVTERELTQNKAISEVSSKWGDKQTISGPIISIPYYKICQTIFRKRFNRKDCSN